MSAAIAEPSAMRFMRAAVPIIVGGTTLCRPGIVNARNVTALASRHSVVRPPPVLLLAPFGRDRPSVHPPIGDAPQIHAAVCVMAINTLAACRPFAFRKWNAWRIGGEKACGARLQDSLAWRVSRKDAHGVPLVLVGVGRSRSARRTCLHHASLGAPLPPLQRILKRLCVGRRLRATSPICRQAAFLSRHGPFSRARVARS